MCTSARPRGSARKSQSEPETARTQDRGGAKGRAMVESTTQIRIQTFRIEIHAFSNTQTHTISLSHTRTHTHTATHDAHAQYRKDWDAVQEMQGRGPKFEEAQRLAAEAQEAEKVAAVAAVEAAGAERQRKEAEV